MMKKILDWRTKDVADIYDEVSLWSAPFGRLLLENMPMVGINKILDLGFGTGFPLIELAQRFGPGKTVMGMDLWEAAIVRAQTKCEVLGLDQIEMIHGSADQIPLQDHHLDLITSNLGINNFENRSTVLEECFRVLKPGGHMCLTTNPIGTFEELYELFIEVAQQHNDAPLLDEIHQHIQHRGSSDSIVKEIQKHGFVLKKKVGDQTAMRFTDPGALFDHGLIRIGFREVWDQWVMKGKRSYVYPEVIKAINRKIKRSGEFTLTIPMLYFHFQKSNL